MKEKPDHAKQVLTARPVLAGQRPDKGDLQEPPGPPCWCWKRRQVNLFVSLAWCLVRSNPVIRMMFHPSYRGTGFSSVACNVCESSISKRKELNEINPFSGKYNIEQILDFTGSQCLVWPGHDWTHFLCLSAGNWFICRQPMRAQDKVRWRELDQWEASERTIMSRSSLSQFIHYMPIGQLYKL